MIGGGPAAFSPPSRRNATAAEAVLLTEEVCEPYEKPPLSKAVLLGKAMPEDTPIAGPGGLGGA